MSLSTPISSGNTSRLNAYGKLITTSGSTSGSASLGGARGASPDKPDGGNRPDATA